MTEKIRTESKSRLVAYGTTKMFVSAGILLVENFRKSVAQFVSSVNFFCSYSNL